MSVLDWKWTIIYVLVHVLTIIGLKVFVSDMAKAHQSLEFRRKYAPFVRKDLHLISFTRSLWWLTIWPRFIFYFSYVAFSTALFLILTAGKDIA